MADESSESETEYRPPDKKRRESKERLIKSPVPVTSSISTHDSCPDLPTDVSQFDTIHLNKLGIFYPVEPETSLECLLEKTQSCVVEIPELEGYFNIIADFLKEHLCFNANHYKDHRDKEKLVQDMLKINDDLKKLQDFSIIDFLSHAGVNKTRELQLVRILENVHVASIDFLEMVMYFMDEEAKKSGTFCFEMMYRELFSAFLKACGLSVRAGECVKKSLILSSGHAIISEPDLRCRLNREVFLDLDGERIFNTLNQDTMIVGEVKRRKGERLDSDNFETSRDLGSYDVLGQIGAELLVELDDTCFLSKEGGNRLVLGAICAGTQIIFTVLEMTRDHFEAILECDFHNSDEKDLGRAVIQHTRPYDLLKAADRQLLYEPLVRLACVQKRVDAFSTSRVKT